jgi:hypothetical protein
MPRTKPPALASARRRYRQFDLWSLDMKLLKTRDQPTKGKGGRSADAQDARRGRATACFGSRGHSIEGQAYFGGEGASSGRCGHTSACPNEEALSEPGFESPDLPADGNVGQPEFGSGFGIAFRAGSDLEDTQSVERKRTAHFNP